LRQANRQKNPTLSTKKEKYGGGISKMNQRTVFWWGERGLARAGGRAELQPSK